VKYGRGLCRTPYSPEFLRRQFDGMDSSWDFQETCLKMLGAEVLHFLLGSQSLENCERSASARPEVAPM
jgi:hypothetical protein